MTDELQQARAAYDWAARRCVPFGVLGDHGNERDEGECAVAFDHLKREIAELEANPNDPEEWADVGILAVGAVARIGGSLYVEMAAKHQKNLAREWGQPDADGVVEHIRAAARTTSAPAEKEG